MFFTIRILFIDILKFIVDSTNSVFYKQNFAFPNTYDQLNTQGLILAIKIIIVFLICLTIAYTLQ